MSEEHGNDFGQKMVQILNHGALNLAMGIGYDLGLFEALDTMNEPCSAEGLAARAGVSARYVEEWLGVMVCGGIVQCLPPDDDTAAKELFLLPKGHADVLTRRAGSANMGVYTREIPLLTRLALHNVQQGFASGEGVAPDVYPEFQEFMQELAAAKYRNDLLPLFLPSIEGGELVTRLQQGIDVCDVGCGSGEALALMAAAYPVSRFTGIDVNADALAAAEHKLQQAGCSNVSLVQADVAGVLDEQWRERFDYVLALDAIHDQQRPLLALQAVHAMLRPEGLFSMVDIAASSGISGNAEHPLGAFLYTVSLMHCLPLGLYQNGRGLGMMWGRETAQSMLKEAGFSSIELVDMPFDPFNDHFLCRK